jgi:hypothetical protein
MILLHILTKKSCNKLPDDGDAKWILTHVRFIQNYKGVFEKHIALNLHIAIYCLSFKITNERNCELIHYSILKYIKINHLSYCWILKISKPYFKYIHIWKMHYVMNCHIWQGIQSKTACRYTQMSCIIPRTQLSSFQSIRHSVIKNKYIFR